MKIMRTKKARTLLGWALIPLLAAAIYARFTPRQNGVRGVPDAKIAIARGDTQFVGVRGMTVGVPGIADGQFNELVLRHGMKEPIGVGDFLISPWDYRRQVAAGDYAYGYNSYLLRYLLDNPDRVTADLLKEIDAEMNVLERSKPRLDAQKSFESTPKFLMVIGSSEFGYDLEDWRTTQVGTRILKMNADVLRGENLARYKNLMKDYVVTYNQTLYRLLQQKWRRDGISTPADIDKMKSK